MKIRIMFCDHCQKETIWNDEHGDMKCKKCGNSLPKESENKSKFETVYCKKAQNDIR